MYIDGLNQEFAPPEEEDYSRDTPQPAQPRSYDNGISERDTRVLTAEEEARVKAQHERYMRSAPVPGYGAADSSALEAAGFQVRTAE